MKLHNLFIVAVLLLAGCAPKNTVVPPAGSKTPVVSPTRGKPTPVVTTLAPPDAKEAVKAFLTAWQNEDFNTMYAMLTNLSQDAITQADFTKRYQSSEENLTLSKLDFDILSKSTTPASAQVAYKVTFHTNLLGDIERQMTMNLSLVDAKWQVEWEDGLIMPELKGGNTLQLEVKVPARGNIYDRSGQALASQTDAVALWVMPGEIVSGQEDTLLTELSRLTGKTPEAIQGMYQNAGKDWKVIVGEAPAAAVQARMQVLSGLGGLHMDSYRDRYYADGGVAPNVVGYESSIFKEELPEYKRKGYTGDERIGRNGIEQWGENFLAGTHGASLHVADPQGKIITLLAETDAQPAESIYTTLDKDLQLQTQKAIQGFSGAAVVLERDTGRVLAMATSPGFDPNMLMPNSANFDPNNAGDQYNRAAMGHYPLGSVFKIITMSAALESGFYTAASTYDCTSYWTEMEGVRLQDWTVSHGLPASGTLTLPDGLMRSCNPWFYHLGLNLFRQKGSDYLASFARAFGLGSPTGIGVIQEDPGNIEDPVDKADASAEYNASVMAIGQYTVLVTPLQVADFVAAVGNGGTLYTPQLIEKIAPLDGTPTFTFQPKPRGTLPVSPDNLKIVQDAMRSVVANNKGTAYYTFAGMQTSIYGKTGTAQSDKENPHAWFVAYTNANRSDKPDIAVAVVDQYAGEGSEFAAPMVRRILEVYFNGQPSRLYPWEASYNVTKTPTPEVTPTETPVPDTPVPADTATP